MAAASRTDTPDRSATRGGPPGWVLLAPLLLVLVLGARELASRVGRDGYRDIDARRARLDPGVEWVDPRWEADLRERLAEQGVLGAEDAAARDRLVAAVAQLSFVAEVGPPAVIWPDGLRLPLRLQQPAACVRVRDAYLPVAADGTLLAGPWPAPPRIGSAWLPVLGPLDGALDYARAGEVLSDERHRDALVTAQALLAALPPADLAVLGRVLIDATGARAAAPDRPGLRLYLEDRRVVIFGRPADTVEPGELPVELKWTALSRALELLRPGEPELDWDLVDLRWDRPEIRRRGSAEPEALLAGG